MHGSFFQYDEGAYEKKQQRDAKREGIKELLSLRGYSPSLCPAREKKAGKRVNKKFTGKRSQRVPAASA